LACAPALAETFDECMAEAPYRVAEAQTPRYCQCAVKHPNDSSACLPKLPQSGPGWHVENGGIVLDK
jgi:hypothetical protein